MGCFVSAFGSSDLLSLGVRGWLQAMISLSVNIYVLSLFLISGAVILTISQASVFVMPRTLTLNQCLESPGWAVLPSKNVSKKQDLYKPSKGDSFWSEHLAKIPF